MNARKKERKPLLLLAPFKILIGTVLVPYYRHFHTSSAYEQSFRTTQRCRNSSINENKAKEISLASSSLPRSFKESSSCKQRKHCRETEILNLTFLSIEALGGFNEDSLIQFLQHTSLW